jgi:hypothetical protein
MWSMMDEIIRERQAMLRAEAERAVRGRRWDRGALGRLSARLVARRRARAPVAPEPPAGVAVAVEDGRSDGSDRRAA